LVSKLSGYKVKGHHNPSSCSAEAGAVSPGITETEIIGTGGDGALGELMDSSE